MDVTAVSVRRLPRVDVVKLAVRVALALVAAVLALPYAVGWVAGMCAAGVQWAGDAVLAGWRDGRRR